MTIVPREWDAVEYDSLPLPHLEWGDRVLAALSLEGNETVVDVGCGTGRDTEKVLKRLPSGKLFAFDASEEMLKQFKLRIGDDTRVQTVKVDISKPMEIEVGANAIMSVAAFHWVSDHEVLFGNLSRIAQPGCQLVFDCGGVGNIDNIRKVVDGIIGDEYHERPWYFADPDSTASLLRASGFDVHEASIIPSPVQIDDPKIFARFLRYVVLGSQIDWIGPERADWLVNEVARNLEVPVVDYVRLFVRASKF